MSAEPNQPSADEPVQEYDGLQVYQISDGDAWIRTIAGNIIDALVFALREASGEYWGKDLCETDATFTVKMDPEDTDLIIDNYDEVVTKTAAQWAHDNGEGALSVSEYRRPPP